MILRHNLLLLLGIIITNCTIAQFNPSSQTDSIHSTKSVSSKYLDRISFKANHLEQKLDKQTAKALHQWQKQEARIKRKLAKKDSVKAVSLFGNVQQQYKQLEQKLQRTTSLQQYIPSLDSLGATLRFLKESPQLLSDAKGVNQKLNNALIKVNGLEEQFQKAEGVKVFLRERKQFLKEQLQNLGADSYRYAKELKKLSKVSYYYQAQVSEYREILKDHKKAEKKTIELLSKVRVFNDFMQKNSFLARLFPMPDAGSNNLAQQSSGFAGLQTRLQVSSFIQQAGLSGPNAISQMQKNIQDAQSQLTELRNRIAQLGGTGGDDLEMPDFKIKNLRTKSFFKRLEYAANFQSQKANNFFPSTSDLGLSVGYRLNEKSVIGIGANYKLGLGSGWNNIKLTHEGIQFVSYVDWKIKGSFGISGGYEQNFRARFKRIDELKHLSGWQQSCLLGLSKTVSLKTKFFKNTKFRLLFDFLSFKQVPKTKALLFRVSYNF